MKTLTSTLAARERTATADESAPFPRFDSHVNMSLDRGYFRWKRILDCVAAVVLLVPGLPLMVSLILLIRLTSPGPAIFRQRRVGRNGQEFLMLKLRSMRIDAEAATGPIWTASARDPRITAVGRVLRLLHLDELPQLWNVLRGEMSIIGPRPERPEFVSVLADEVHGYHQRLAVMPGVTGLAQINLPADTDLDSVRRKLALDREYIGTAGFLLDLRIALCTVLRMMGVRGGRGVRLLGLQRHVLLPPSKTTAEDSGPEEPVMPTPEQLATAARRAPRHAVGTGSQPADGNGNNQSQNDPRIRDTVSDIRLTDTAERSLLRSVAEPSRPSVANSKIAPPPHRPNDAPTNRRTDAPTQRSSDAPTHRPTAEPPNRQTDKPTTDAPMHRRIDEPFIRRS